MRFGKEWLDEVLSVNPAVVFTHRNWSDSGSAVESFREAGVDDVHVVPVDGHSGELAIIHQLSRHLEIPEEQLTTCKVFLGGDFVGDASIMPKGRSLAQKCMQVGARVHTPPPPLKKTVPGHSPDRLFIQKKKGL